MLTYAVVLLVVIAVLYGSYRALGGADPVPAEDYRMVLGRLTDLTSERVAELRAALGESRPPQVGTATGTSRPAADPLVERAGELRRKLTGYRQQLDRLEVSAAGDELDVLTSARTLLTAAVEDHAWACRLVEGGSYHENPGIQDAVAALREHGGRCLEAAAEVLTDRAAGSLSL